MYLGEIGKRLTVTVTYVKSFDYVDYKFSYYGTTHYTHIFKDSNSNILVWKSTNVVEYLNNDCYEFIPVGSTVELTGTVKEHSFYKDSEQTVVTRCKFKLIERKDTKLEIKQKKIEEQKSSIGEKDFIWTMPYRQYKEHYSDCETVIDSYNPHENNHGIRYGDPTIDVIIRDGRLKPSGVRGKHFYWFTFEKANGGKIAYYAVCEENARKQMIKDYPDSADWECIKIDNFKSMYI